MLPTLENNVFSDEVVRTFENIVPKLPSALIGLLVGILIIKLLSWFGQALLGLVRMPSGLRGIMISMLDGVLWVVLAVSILQTLGLEKLALALSGSIAILGLAVATGASSLAADILAGIFLAKDRDFSVGDNVIAGENKTEGVIEKMDMRRTRIRGKDGQLHVIPNSVIERKEWVLLEKKSTKR
jgi:moderate conductance mechanosensitive channel